MARKAPRMCAVSKCPNTATHGGRCERHALPRVDTRDSASARGYGWAWKRNVRDPYLSAHPYCVNPYGVHDQRVRAVVVDHITPRRHGGSDAPSNLQSLCVKCHAIKTVRDGSGGGGGKKSKTFQKITGVVGSRVRLRNRGGGG